MSGSRQACADLFLDELSETNLFLLAMEDWKKLIFFEDISFHEKASAVFEYQFENNSVYRRYCIAIDMIRRNNSSEFEYNLGEKSVKKEKEKILNRIQTDISTFPLFPIQGFKDTELTCLPGTDHDLIFKSSGTSGMSRSRHPVNDAGIYRQSLLQGFRQFYDLDRAVILAYTPGYSENPNSSLIWMLKELISQDESGLSRFLPLQESLKLKEINTIKESGKQLILFGAAFGLIDLVEISNLKLPSDSIVIETGGMKTHKREIGRMDMHKRLSDGFGLEPIHIHSEYGMAELLSQAYALGGKWFRTVPWMHVSIRNPDNPQEILPPFQEGLIGVIDLANVHSCSFLLTGDKGVMHHDGRFQVLGRWNPKDLRGCNFLIEED